MSEQEWLADRFAAHRAHLTAVARRMLGSPAEADDAVQETWLRLSRTDSTAIDNLGGWLTTVVARVSLDMLRSRASRREEPVERVSTTTPERSHRPVILRMIPSRIPSRRRSWPTRSALRCSSCSTRSARPSGWPSCCTTCSRCRSIRSVPSSSARLTPPSSSPAGPATRCRGPSRTRTPIPPGNARSSRPSSPPHAAVTSRRWSRYSIPTSRSGPTPPPSAWDRPRRSVVRRLSPACSPGARGCATCAHRRCRRHAVGGRRPPTGRLGSHDQAGHDRPLRHARRAGHPRRPRSHASRGLSPGPAFGAMSRSGRRRLSG